MLFSKSNSTNIVLLLSFLEKSLEPDITQLRFVLNKPPLLRSLLRTALNNRVLFAFVSAVHKEGLIQDAGLNDLNRHLLTNILSEGRKILKKLRRTITFIIEKRVPALIIKTLPLWHVQDITFDVDLLIKDRESFFKIKHLFKDNFIIKVIDGGYELIPKSDELLTIDIYYDFLNHGNRIIDPEFLWNNYKSVKLDVLELKAPSAEGELLLHFSQILFQNRFITLNDFLRFTNLSLDNNITWNRIIAETKRFKWDAQFINLLSLLSRIRVKLWKTNTNINLPIFLPPLPKFIPNERFSYMEVAFKYCVDLGKYFILNKLPIYQDWFKI